MSATSYGMNGVRNLTYNFEHPSMDRPLRTPYMNEPLCVAKFHPLSPSSNPPFLRRPLSLTVVHVGAFTVTVLVTVHVEVVVAQTDFVGLLFAYTVAVDTLVVTPHFSVSIQVHTGPKICVDLSRIMFHRAWPSKFCVQVCFLVTVEVVNPAGPQTGAHGLGLAVVDQVGVVVLLVVVGVIEGGMDATTSSLICIGACSAKGTA